MTLMIDLTPEEHMKLRQLAAWRGQTEDELAHELFRRALDLEWQNEIAADSPKGA